MASNIGVAVAAVAGVAVAWGVSKLLARAAVAGVAMLAWGVSKLFGETSDDQQRNNNKKNDYYILNFDGSDINQHQRGGAGCIIRNKQGELVIAASYNLDNLYQKGGAGCVQFHVAIAEAVALRNGLKLAKSKKIKLDLIKGDNKEVIHRVIGNERKAAGVPFLNEVIREIREALYEQSINPETQIKLIDREANSVAHELATLGSKFGYGMEKIYAKEEDLTYELARLIKEDNFPK